MTLPTMRLVRQIRNAEELAIVYVFGEAIAKRVNRSREHLNAVGLQAPDFDRAVTVRHRDGSVLVYRHAFTVALDDYHGVFTEHHGYHVFHREDVETIGEDRL
jgi:hypothetical protein